jgi:hypothetical protein
MYIADSLVTCTTKFTFNISTKKDSFYINSSECRVRTVWNLDDYFSIHITHFIILKLSVIDFQQIRNTKVMRKYYSNHSDYEE